MDAAPPGELDLLLERLGEEPAPFRRRQALQARRGLWSPETVARMYEEVVRLIHVDVARADRLARSALWLALKLRDAGSQAASLRAVGHVLDRRRKYGPALRRYERAAALYADLDRPLEVARTLSASLQSLIYLGRYDEARMRAGQARDIFSSHGDELRLARLDANLGNLLHRQDRFEEAMELYRRGYAALDRVGSSQDVAIVLQNMATCQIGMGDYPGALETYRRTRAHCLRHDMPLLVAVADYNIAYLYYLRGEYTQAIELYGAARRHCHELGDDYREALCDLDQSEMYVELNLDEEGAHLARRALAAFRRLGVNYEAAKAVTNIAISLTHHGDAAQALELFARARQWFAGEGNQAWISTIELYQAIVFHRQKRFGEAAALCESAYRFFAPSPFSGKAALCQLLLARNHLDAGRPVEAKNACLTALARAEQAESPALACQACFVLGQIEEEMGASEAAYTAYRKAHENLENLRSHLKADELKVAFLKDKLEIYEALVRITLGQGGEGAEREAFAYIEQAKSRSLADLIAFRAQNLPAPAREHRMLVERVKSLREEVNWLTRAVQLQESRSGGLKDPRAGQLRGTARAAELKLVEAMQELRLEGRESASLQTAASTDLEAIQSVVPTDSVLVQYFRVQDRFLACLLRRGSLEIVPLGAASELRRALQLLRFQLSKFRLGPEYVQTFGRQLLEAANAHLREFHAALIAPLGRRLEAAHVIFAPHDFLHHLPFHALLDGDEPLFARFSVSYTPSASVYYLCQAKRAEAGEGALILGVPDEMAPRILDEVEAVASVMPAARVFKGPEATAAVLREHGARCRFLHIATHGSFRQDNPMFSSIRLGDTQLNLFDLYQLDLPAELITLSGCGTGLNVVVGGDELMGLKRGLLYAGAQCLLLTLWDVNDQSTAAFMKLAYERLKAGASKAEAVRHAMGEIRGCWPHPYYWAPFILVGSPS